MPKEIQKLIAGYKLFNQEYKFGKYPEYKQLVHGQKPKAIVISCCDSRVDPSTITKCQPGDLFVVRNVANLVPPFENDGGYHGTSAALEFAVLGLGIKHVIIIGHSKCGGINHLVTSNKNASDNSFVAKWMEIARDAKRQVKENNLANEIEDKVDLCAQYSIINSIENLSTFPWFKEKLDAGEIFVHGWFFNIGDCELSVLDQDMKKFQVVSNNG